MFSDHSGTKLEIKKNKILSYILLNPWIKNLITVLIKALQVNNNESMAYQNLWDGV